MDPNQNPPTPPQPPATPPARPTPETVPPAPPSPVVMPPALPTTPGISDTISPEDPTLQSQPLPAPGQVVSGGFDPAASNASLQPGQLGALPPSPPNGQAPAAVAGSTTPLAGAVPTRTKKRRLKRFLIALLIILILGGASAAAYVGIIVPNKPANILKTAIANSLQEPQVRTNGSLEGGAATGNGLAYKLTFTTASDSAAKAGDLQLNLTVSGVTFPVEARLVKQNLYIKVGDLSTITSLVKAYSPEIGSFVQSVSGNLSNKWIVVDSTLLNESGAVKCLLHTDVTITKADINQLESQYAKQPFVTIQKTSQDTVGGQPAEKFVLSIDDDKASAYSNNLNNLPIVKNLNKCPGASSSKNAIPATKNHTKTPLTVWVDKRSKHIVQITAHSTSQDAQKSNLTGSFTMNLHYGNVSIAEPNNPEPAIQALTQIQNSLKSNPSLLNLFSGGTAAAGGASGNTLLQ